jgi:hypothetical protein
VSRRPNLPNDQQLVGRKLRLEPCRAAHMRLTAPAGSGVPSWFPCALARFGAMAGPRKLDFCCSTGTIGASFKYLSRSAQHDFTSRTVEACHPGDVRCTSVHG